MRQTVHGASACLAAMLRGICTLGGKTRLRQATRGRS